MTIQQQRPKTGNTADRPAAPTSRQDSYWDWEAGARYEAGQSMVWITPSGDAAYTRPPLAAAWSTVNLSPATFVDDDPSVVLDAPADGSPNARLALLATPATPFTLTAKLDVLAGLVNTVQAGLVLRESGSGKFIAYGWISDGTPVVLAAQHWTDEHTYTSDITFSYQPLVIPATLWLQIEDDGANVTCRYSNDGRLWLDFATEPTGTWVAEDQAGIFISNLNGSNPLDVFLRLRSWVMG